MTTTGLIKGLRRWFPVVPSCTQWNPVVRFFTPVSYFITPIKPRVKPQVKPRVDPRVNHRANHRFDKCKCVMLSPPHRRRSHGSSLGQSPPPPLPRCTSEVRKIFLHFMQATGLKTLSRCFISRFLFDARLVGPQLEELI